MTIQEFIRNRLRKRLEHGCALVVYDPETRYVDIARAMNDDVCTVIDGSDSTILGRERAMDAWRAMAEAGGDEKRLIVYLPFAKPRTDRERQRNPYQIFAIGGGEFPQSDGESYQALCLP